MSGYPSLISPLMDEQGLILTEALNQDAQTALALSVTNEADIAVLEETALQLQGDPAEYTGLPDTAMSLNGNLKMNNNDITNVNEITATFLSVKNVDVGNYYAITGNAFGIQVGGNLITPDDITCNTLNYTELNPPISGATPTLSQVLTAGSDATGQVIENLDGLFVGSVNVKNVDSTNYYQITGNLAGLQVGTNIITPDNITCNILNYTELNPPISGGSQNIEQVLINGSNANGQSLSGLANLTSVNVQSTNAGGTAVIKANDIGIYNNNGTTQKAVISKDGNIFSQNYYLYGQSASDFAITNNKNILTTGNITSNLLTSQTVSTPALTSSLGYITSPSIVMPVGSLTCKNGAGNGVIETNAIRIYSDASTYSAVLATDGTVFAKSYQMFNQVPSKFSVSNAGSVFATKLEVDETLADSSSSVGTAGQVLSSTGTGIQWITPSAGSTPSLSDVMTVGNTASTILNMNNNTVDNAFSVFTKTLYSVDNVEGGNIYSNNLTIQDGTGTPQLTIAPVGDITTSGTIQSADITVGTTPGQQVILSNIGEVRCSSLNIPSDALTPAFSITNDGTAFTTKLEIGETLADASNSVGTAGQLLSSTGTATAWVDAPSSNPTLGDVMTNGNTASTTLNMNNQAISSILSLGSDNFSILLEKGLNCNNKQISNINYATANTIETNILKSNDPNNLSAPIVVNNDLNLGLNTFRGNVMTGSSLTIGNIQKTPSNPYISIFSDMYLQANDIIDAGAVGCASVTATGQVKGRTIKSDEEGKDDAFSNKLSTFRVQSTGQVYGYSGTFSDGLEVTSGAVQLGTGDVYLATNNIIVSGATGNITTAGLINGTNINFRPSYDYYVAKNGSDSNPGSVLSPFLTVQKAIDVCEAFTDNVPRNVNIFYGSYNENLTISKSRIAFNGTNEGGSRADTGCSINGTITINVSTGLSDMNNNNIYFNNLFLGNVISDTSSIVHRVGFKNCLLYNDQVKILDFQPTADYRLYVDYCSILNADDLTTDTMVLCGGSGMVSFSNNQITQRGKGHVVSIQDSCRIDVFVLNVLTNDNSSAQCLAICKLGSTTANTAYTLGQNAFVYSSTTSKSSAAPYFSTGILMDVPATKTNFLFVINNTFSMSGLANSLTNFAITGTRNPSATAYVFYGNNVGISTFLSPYSFQIDSGSGINKNALQSVQ